MNLNRIATIKWGIIGPGAIARDFVNDLQTLVGFPHVVVGVMSVDGEEAQRFAMEHQISRAFDDLDLFLEEASPDIVYIATPHTTHYSYSMACLHRHVAVLCEKPWALDPEEAQNMVDLARAKGVFLMEGMWIRFLPSIRQLLVLLERHVIGSVHSLSAEIGFRAPYDLTNRFYNPALGGGSLFDVGIYPIYLSLLIFGMAMKIQAAARIGPSGVDESCAMVFEYFEGAYALLESSIIKDTRREACIFGENGVIIVKSPWYEKSPAIEVKYYDGRQEAYSTEWAGRGFQYEIREVEECLRHKTIESKRHSHMTGIQLSSLINIVRSKINEKTG